MSESHNQMTVSVLANKIFKDIENFQQETYSRLNFLREKVEELADMSKKLIRSDSAMLPDGVREIDIREVVESGYPQNGGDVSGFLMRQMLVRLLEDAAKGSSDTDSSFPHSFSTDEIIREIHRAEGETVAKRMVEEDPFRP